MLNAKTALLLTLLAPSPLACANATATRPAETKDQVSAHVFFARCSQPPLAPDASPAAPPSQVFVELGVFEVPEGTTLEPGAAGAPVR